MRSVRVTVAGILIIGLAGAATWFAFVAASDDATDPSVGAPQTSPSPLASAAPSDPTPSLDGLTSDSPRAIVQTALNIHKWLSAHPEEWWLVDEYVSSNCQFQCEFYKNVRSRLRRSAAQGHYARGTAKLLALHVLGRAHSNLTVQVVVRQGEQTVWDRTGSVIDRDNPYIEVVDLGFLRGDDQRWRIESVVAHQSPKRMVELGIARRYPAVVAYLRQKKG